MGHVVAQLNNTNSAESSGLVKSSTKTLSGKKNNYLSKQSTENQAYNQLQISRINGLAIQRKLTIGHAEDKYEQEADRVADQVMRMSTLGSVKSAHPQSGSTIQRKCQSCEEEKIQRKAATGITDPVFNTSQVSQSLKSSGAPLDQTTRAFFEPRFAYDFSKVRIHSDNQADQAARSINARAFTVGSSIAFQRGEYSPETRSGRRLLAHELTHVVQQSGVSNTYVQRQTQNDDAANANETMDDAERDRLNEALCIGREAGDGPTRCEFTRGQLRRVDAAKREARRLSARAGLALHSTDPYIRKLARRFFQVDNLDIDRMLQTIDSIRDSLDSVSVLCGTCADGICNDGTSAVAYVPDDLSAIVICPFFFAASTTEMIRTFIHEAGHYVGIDHSDNYSHPPYCRTQASTDCVEACANVGGDRLRNVDVWAHFIDCAAYSY